MNHYFITSPDFWKLTLFYFCITIIVSSLGLIYCAISGDDWDEMQEYSWFGFIVTFVILSWCFFPVPFIVDLIHWIYRLIYC